MGIQPPSDLILDVINAADPTKAQAMATRLRQASSTSSATAFSGQFDTEMRQMGLPVDQLSVLSPASSMNLRNATALAQKGAVQGNSETYRQFEAMILSSFVQNMMPAKASSVFGSGTAGEVWRSMLSEKIANEASKAGGIGIAQRVSASVARSAAAADNLPPPVQPSEPKA
ncbi:rod-binding protein [Aquabacter cavernae]|uniref:rod-binding protein n=1 Tax=Aquabacter cavernae TaxID=2496029 RepID=UPI000F8F407E|nr:rod-binding protein [Aquabacter cavernae]